MDRESDLERVRKNAVGKELDEELVKQFPVKRQYEVQIPTRHGEVHCYVFVPMAGEGKLPAIVNFHGGGFVKGYRGRDILFSRNLACHTNCTVIDVDYKVAPEYQYPYALEEGYDAVNYILTHEETFGIDRRKIFLSGQSAGGNLATGITLMAKEKKEFSVLLTMVSYPPLDLAKDPAKKRFADLETERVETARLYNDWYIEKSRRTELYASPVYASREKLTGLTPFLIITAQKDTLSEEAEKFAYQLIEAGVTVTAKQIRSAVHGFLVRRSEGFGTAEKLIFGMVRQYLEGADS